MKLHSPRSVLGLIIAHLFFLLLDASAAPSVPPRERILILVSLDGFRSDYLEKFKPPHLNKLAAEEAKRAARRDYQ